MVNKFDFDDNGIMSNAGDSIMLENAKKNDFFEQYSKRKLYISAKFKRDFRRLQQPDLRKKVTDILNELSVLLYESPSDVSFFLKNLNAKKFKSANNFWKFYVSDAHRIIYAFGKEIGRHDQSDSIFILRYVFDHDRQGDIARESKLMASTSTFDSHMVSNVDESEDENLIIDYCVEDEIAYVALSGKVDELLRNSNSNMGVLLNSEQMNCIKPDYPLIIKGSAGSGKTIVSVEIMKMAYQMSKDAIYITFTEGLRSLAQREFEIATGIKSDNFYSFNEYCISRLGLNKLNYVDLYDFKKWYLNSYGHLKFEVEDIWAEIRGIIKGYMGIHWSNDIQGLQLLPESIYLDGSGFESKFDYLEKKQIYSVTTRYCSWLNDNNSYDDNDLALLMARKLNLDGFGTESILVIDEVQDLTERQILMLANSVKDDHLYISGDPNQIINPTLFSFERLSNLFYLRKNKAPYLVTLKNNYRNSAPIVDYINDIGMQRKKLIGSQKWEDDLEESAMRKDTSGIRLLNILPTNKNLVETIEIFEDTPNAAVIVATKSDKLKLENLLGRSLGCVLTIYEVKGLEFNYVFCYNLISENLNMWSEIISGKGRRSTAHRFLFNIYYVAATRAKEYLYFFEDYTDVYFADLNSIKTVEDITFENLEMDTNRDPLEWYDDGIKYERVGLFEKAIRAYNMYMAHSGISSEREIKRCEALSLMETDKTQSAFKLAGEMLIEVDELYLAERVFKSIGIDYKVFECRFKMGHRQHKDLVGNRDIDSIITEGFKDEAFSEFFVDEYLVTRARDLSYNCEILTDILLPDIMGVN